MQCVVFTEPSLQPPGLVWKGKNMLQLYYRSVLRLNKMVIFLCFSFLQLQDAYCIICALDSSYHNWVAKITCMKMFVLIHVSDGSSQWPWHFAMSEAACHGREHSRLPILPSTAKRQRQQFCELRHQMSFRGIAQMIRDPPTRIYFLKVLKVPP